MNILITDIDEVLLNWSKSFDQFIRDELDYEGEYIVNSQKRLWELLNTDKANIGQIMHRHAMTEEFSKLDYKNDSYLLNEVNNPKKLFDKIIAVTSCGTHITIQNNRNKNIEQKFPNIIDRVVYLDFLEDKGKIIDQLINQYDNADIYMIDDSVPDVEYALEHGVHGFVYKSSFFNPKKLPVVSSLEEFFSKVSEVKK